MIDGHDRRRQPLGRLVEQQQLWPERQRARNRHHLALAAGQRLPAALAIALELREHTIGFGDALLARGRSLGRSRSASRCSRPRSGRRTLRSPPARSRCPGARSRYGPQARRDRARRTSIAPDAGLRKPMMVRNVVVLPAPLRPTRQTSSPAPTSNDTPRSTRLPWMSTTRSRTASISAPAACRSTVSIRCGSAKNRSGGRSASTLPSDSAMMRCE